MRAGIKGGGDSVEERDAEWDGGRTRLLGTSESF